MPETASKSQIWLARFVVVLVIAFIIWGAMWYGFSAEARQRVWEDLINRPGGPLTFRFILQPIMATITALLDGIRDAKSGRSPYFWSLVTSSQERGGRLWEGVVATSRIILLGLVMDVIYQLIVFETLYPGEAVIVAIVLAFVPYLLLRGPFARLASWWWHGIHVNKSH